MWPSCHPLPLPPPPVQVRPRHVALLSWTVARSRPQAHRFLTLMGRVTARFSNHFSSKNMAMVQGGGGGSGGWGREEDATATVQLPGLMGEEGGSAFVLL